MFRKLPILIFALMIMVPSLAFAGAKVGQKIPHDLMLKNQNAEVQDFASLSGEKGIVLFFVRSVDWCPYCQVQLLDLRSDGPAIEKTGYNIVVLSYDTPELQKAFADKYKFSYTLLSDEGSEAIKAFGILNETFDPDHFAYGVPHPYVFVINNDKSVRAILNEEGYKKRPAAEAILNAIAGRE